MYIKRPRILIKRERMNVIEAIQKRRAKRAIDSRPVEEEKLAALLEAMRLAPSCNNNQPWRVVICRSPESLAKARLALTKGNVWATRAPVIFVIAARLEEDCHQSDRRDYFLFSCGQAVGQMCLRATELDLIAHPIAGFDPLVDKKELGIPDDCVVITNVIIGYLGQDQSLLSDKQKVREDLRPERKLMGESFFDGLWGVPLTLTEGS